MIHICNKCSEYYLKSAVCPLGMTLDRARRGGAPLPLSISPKNVQIETTEGKSMTGLYSLSISFVESNSTGGPLFLGFFDTLATTRSETGDFSRRDAACLTASLLW